MASEKKRQSVRSNRVCFTLNFKGETSWPTNVLEEVNASLSRSHQDGALRYAIVGKEVAPTTGVPHLQGYIAMQPTVLPASKGLVKTWRSLFPFLARAHLETALGTDMDSKAYCSKEEILCELGVPSAPKTMVEFVQLTMEEQLMEDPQLAIKSRFQLDKIFAQMKRKQLMEEVARRKCAKFASQLRGWQEKLLTLIGGQTDRHIFFVEDVQGNTGKSWMAQFLRSSPDYNACVLSSGKAPDLAFTFKNHFLAHGNEYTVFDMTRCIDEQYWPWSTMEALKNGLIVSAKYESESFECFEQKIVVFCNKIPDNIFEKLSFDRVRKFIIDDNKLIEQY